MSTITTPEGVQVLAEVTPAQAEILTTEALALVAKLHREFEPRREELLARRVERAKEIDAGADPDFLPETKHIRDDPSWKVAPAPADLQDRRAEITGPVDRKMIINALNSGAKVFMSDFEDSNTPTWSNTIDGQINLRDAVDGTISFSSKGKEYAPRRDARHAAGAPARLAPAREARPHRRRAGLGRHLRLRALHVPQREEPARQGLGSVLLPAQDGEPPRGPPLERHHRHDAGRDRRAPGQRPRDRPHRDDPGRVRDGGDPLRAARPLGRPQLRALGLHLQLHQEVPHPPGLRARRPRAGHDDHALPQLVLTAGDQDLPPARCARDRRHGGPDPDQERPDRQRGGAREGEGRQGARGRQRARRHLGGAPRPRRRSRSTPSTR